MFILDELLKDGVRPNLGCQHDTSGKREPQLPLSDWLVACLWGIS